MKKEELLDILKKDNKMSFSEFKTKHPKESISEWTFYRSRKLAVGEDFPSALKQRARRHKESKNNYKVVKKTKEELRQQIVRDPSLQYSDAKTFGVSESMFYYIKRKAIGDGANNKTLNRVYTVIGERNIPDSAIESVRWVLDRINSQSGTSLTTSIIELADGTFELRNILKGKRGV